MKQPIDNGRQTMPDDELSGMSRQDGCDDSCGSFTDAPWFCLWTRPNQERVALQELRQQGYPTYLPLFFHKLPNRSERIDCLFPRYIFAQPIDGLWSSMRSTRGVTDIIRDPLGKPREVPRRAVAALLAQCAPNLIIYPAEVAEIRKDTNARALAGPLSGFTGICTRTTRDRVWLLLNLLGRPTEVAFSREAVEAA